MDADEITRACGLVVDHEFDDLVGSGEWSFWQNVPMPPSGEFEMTRRGWHGRTIVVPWNVGDASAIAGWWWRRRTGEPKMKDPSEDYAEQPAEAATATDPESRACVRCLHYREDHWATEEKGNWCQRPQLGSTFDAVQGVKVPNTRGCYPERSADGEGCCGPEGKFFEPSGF